MELFLGGGAGAAEGGNDIGIDVGGGVRLSSSIKAASTPPCFSIKL